MPKSTKKPQLPTTSLRKPNKRSATIQPSILAYIAWRNLTSKKLRTFLTVLGVVIGVGAIYFLLSFGLGLQRLVTNEIIGDKSVKLIEVSSPNSSIIKLDEQNVATIRELPHASELSTEYSFPGILSFNSAEIDTVTYGISQSFQSHVTLNLTHGRLLSDSDDRQVLINTTALQAIGISDANQAIGKQINLTIPLKGTGDGRKQIANSFEIVGVIDSGSGSELFLPGGLFSAAGVDAYKVIRILADERANVSNLRSQVESLGLQTQSPADTLDQVNQIFRFFNIILIGFGSIGMFVAVIGMLNTITVSLLERTKEIGLMVALGARKLDMRKLFIIETSLISLIGAVIGIVAAMIGGFVINIVMNQLAARRGVEESFALFANPPWLIALMIIFMLSIGFVVAYLPSRRAEKINPIDALRRE